MKKTDVTQPKASSTEDDIRKLVIARLELVSPGTSVSIGSEGTFSRDELIQAVEKGDDLGKQIENIQLEWLRSWKERADIYGTDHAARA